MILFYLFEKVKVLNTFGVFSRPVLELGSAAREISYGLERVVIDLTLSSIISVLNFCSDPNDT